MKNKHMLRATVAALVLGCAAANVYADEPNKPHALSDGNRDMPAATQGEPVDSEGPVGTDAEGAYTQGEGLESFFEDASANNLAAIESAKAALKEGSPAIREYAQQLLDYHTAANLKLAALAKNLEVEVSNDPGLLDQSKQWLLEKRDGDSFDAAYLNTQITEHQRAIELYKGATNSRDQELSAYIEKTLSDLQAHLEQAKALSRAGAEAQG